MNSQLTDLFREVDEDLRAERWSLLWRRYGGFALAAAVAVVIIAGGLAWKRQHDAAERAAGGDRYAAAVARASGGDADKAIADLRAVGGELGGGYGVLARFTAAGVAADRGKLDDALAQYDSIATDAKADALFRDLAALAAASYRVDRADPVALVEPALQPLLDAASPWRFSAREIWGAALLKAGRTAEARQEFQKLADDASAPRGVRARAAELLAALPV